MDIRYSFSTFGITRIAGRVLLLVNKNRLQKKGEIVLTLPGGAYAIDPIVESLFTQHGARYIRKTPLSQQLPPYPMTDLRFMAPEENAEALCGVYEQRFGSDPSTVINEYREELYQETHVLRHRDLRDFTKITYSHMARERSVTTRGGEEGLETIRMMSFFDVDLTLPATVRVARMADRRPLHQQVLARLRKQYTGSYVYLATDDEIMAGRTENEAEIAGITKLMFG